MHGTNRSVAGLVVGVCMLACRAASASLPPCIAPKKPTRSPPSPLKEHGALALMLARESKRAVMHGRRAPVTLTALDLPPLSEISNSTLSSSLSERKPCCRQQSQIHTHSTMALHIAYDTSAWMAVWCTKMSSPPSVGVMKPSATKVNAKVNVPRAKRLSLSKAHPDLT